MEMGLLTRTAAALGLLGLLAGLAPSCAAAPGRPAAAGGIDPALLRVTDMDAQPHDLASVLERGHAVALVFWSPWCEGCKEEAPGIAAAEKEYGEEIRFYGVVPGPDETVDDDEVRRTAAAFPYDFPQVRDRDLALTRGFEVTGTPTVIVLGPGPAVRYREHAPPADWSAFRLASREILRERRLEVMGTELLIEAVGPDADRLDRAIEAAIAEIRRVEDLMTDWRPSPLTALNDAAGRGPREVPDELARLLASALEVGRVTGGAFDVTYAGVGRLWDFRRDPPVVPEPAAVEDGLRHVGLDQVEVDVERGTVSLPEGFRIGLGGIAKGYGVDRAMKVLMDHGVRHAMVNAGGDLKALGRKRGKLWEIAIRHPRDRERVLAVLPVSNTCVVTSGDYERFFEKDGRRYHHIIDPRTGYPSTGCMSATVVAPDAAIADALATALCVLGPEEGLALVERLDRVEALLVGMDGVVVVSKGLESGAARSDR